MDVPIRFCRSRDSCRIAYAASGTGPVVVQAPTWLTHLELDWNGTTWRPWLDELVAGHTLVRYDLRGCGLSSRVVDDLSLDAMVEDLKTVVDAQGLDHFPLVGHCQGGVIAAAFTARHPERVSRLLLYGSYLQGGLAPGRTSEAVQEVETLEALIQTGWGRRNPAFRELFACMLMPAAPPEKARALAEMERRSAAAPVAQRLWRAFHLFDITEDASRIGCPTLVAHVREDAMVPFSEGCRLAAAIPDARFLPLEGRNHVLQVEEEAWDRFWGEAHAFLASGSATSEGSARGIGSIGEGFDELTPREREVLEWIARGRSNDEIARGLSIQPKTVRNHITRIFDKLGVERRAEAIVRAREAGFGRGSA